MLTLNTFVPHVGSRFVINVDAAQTIALELTTAEDLGSNARQEQFHLLFQGPPDSPLRQSIYTLEHPALGTMELFLVPIARKPEGFVYQAVFNRLVAPQ